MNNNKQRKRLFIAILSFSLAVMMIGGVTFGRTMVQTTQKLETGIVDIHITPHSISAGKAGQYKDPGALLPGQMVSFMPRITADGAHCWIRARFAFDRLNKYLDDNVFGISDKWVYNQADGYWYYTIDVKNREYADFFQGFTVSPEMTDEHTDEKFNLKVTAEAIQYTHFIPDFKSKSPWRNEKVQVVTADTYSIEEGVVGNDTLEVTYLGGSDKMIASPDDMFSNLPQMMPGDEFEQTIHIKNDSEFASKLYFWTDAMDKKDILDKISLVVMTEKDGQIISLYDGPLRSTKLQGEKYAVLLGEYASGAEGKISFRLSVPASLDNKYVLNKSQVKWYFATDPEIPDTPKGTPTPYTQKSTPYTGDPNDTGLYLFLIGAAATVVSIAVYRKRKLL